MPRHTQRSRLVLLWPVVCLGGALLLIAGCDPSVDVFEPTDRHRFSLYGALNVAADTQVIRVDPLDDTTQYGAPPRIDAVVTLENLDNGREVAFRDSLARVGVRDYPVHNFWTTHPIQPGTSYRIAVKQGGETVTSATTTTPPNPPDLTHKYDFYLPCVFPRPGSSDPRKAPNTLDVIARNVESIAAADIIYPITYQRPGRGAVRSRIAFNHYDDVTETGRYFEISIFYRPALVDLNPEPGPSKGCTNREHFTHPYALVAVAAGGPEWPDWRGVPFDVYSRPDSLSNVQGGHGFVGGIYSDTIKVPIQDRPPPAG